MPIPYLEPSSTHPHPSPPASPSKWGPYSNASNYGANMIIILVILFCALVLILALIAVIRYLLCSFRRSHNHSRNLSDFKKQTDKKTPSPTTASFANLIFSVSTKLAGTEAECSICLGEFVDGDRLILLPACNHGFHTSCIQKWIESRKSCPTCRANCNIVKRNHHSCTRPQWRLELDFSSALLLFEDRENLGREFESTLKIEKAKGDEIIIDA